MRGRNRGGGGGGGGGKNHNPLTRVYESNGPDVKIRGTANHIAEKYIQLARDAQASGDPVAAENYYQHAEHYFRLIAAAQEQFRQNQPFTPRPEGGGEQQQPQQSSSENFDDGEDDPQQPHSGGGEPHYPREMRDQQQPYPQRDNQQYQQRHQPRDNHQQNHQPHQQNNRPQYDNRPQPQPGESSSIDQLPSFITGGQPQPQQGQNNPDHNSQNFGNGYDNQGGNRFQHRGRGRRHHRGPRPDMQGNAPQPAGGNEGSDDSAPPSGAGPAAE
ncbi:MAG: DUF4167 domain-containing protein [Pseudorhodoplanes sp.]